eukprot:Opistho-1_new@69566
MTAPTSSVSAYVVESSRKMSRVAARFAAAVVFDERSPRRRHEAMFFGVSIIATRMYSRVDGRAVVVFLRFVGTFPPSVGPNPLPSSAATTSSHACAGPIASSGARAAATSSSMTSTVWSVDTRLEVLPRPVARKGMVDTERTDNFRASAPSTGLERSFCATASAASAATSAACRIMSCSSASNVCCSSSLMASASRAPPLVAPPVVDCGATSFIECEPLDAKRMACRRMSPADPAKSFERAAGNGETPHIADSCVRMLRRVWIVPFSRRRCSSVAALLVCVADGAPGFSPLAASTARTPVARPDASAAFSERPACSSVSSSSATDSKSLFSAAYAVTAMRVITTIPHRYHDVCAQYPSRPASVASPVTNTSDRHSCSATSPMRLLCVPLKSRRWLRRCRCASAALDINRRRALPIAVVATVSAVHSS